MRVSAYGAIPLALAVLFAPRLAAQTNRGGAAVTSITGFGSAVAVSGDEIFVGRPGETSIFPAPASEYPAVHVFRVDPAGNWAETAAVTADEPAVGIGFGNSIAAEGNVLVVGATKYADHRGAAYVFERGADGRWRQVALLEVPDGMAGDSFGEAVAVRFGIILVGAPGSGPSGAAYAFGRFDSGWSYVAKLEPESGESGARFGAAVDLERGVAIVGAPGPAAAVSFLGGAPDFMPGAAYIFGQTDDVFFQVARLTSSIPDVAALGSAVDIQGNEAIVSAPATGGPLGALLLFRRDASGAWSEAGSIAPENLQPPALLGMSMARSGSHLFVGAPLSSGLAGAMYVFTRDASGEWNHGQRVAGPPAFGFAGLMGWSVAAGADFAVAGSPADAFFDGLGQVVRLDEATGEWALSAAIHETATGFASVTGGQQDCREGSAGDFTCSEVDLVSFLSVGAIGGERGIMVNDVWGWTDPETGHEYVLIGRFDATAFVDITDAANPVYVGQLPLTAGSNPNLWRDIKVYANHAYIVADNAGEHGVQIFDLTRLRGLTGDGPVTFEETAHYSGINSAHNIVINEETGFAYAVGASGGGETCGGGLHMIDIRQPENPIFAGCFQDMETGNQSTGYSHDAQCIVYAGPDTAYQGHEICFGANETALSIADVTDKNATVAVSNASYPNVGYAHQGWVSNDHRYFFLDDELDELAGTAERTRTLVWDIEDLDDPVLVTEFMGTTASSDHNLYVQGNYMYQANYVSGLRIIDISDPANPVEVGFFDTVPLGEDAPGFAGAFSVYPYFESGVIVVSSMKEGLFVLRKRSEALVP